MDSWPVCRKRLAGGRGLETKILDPDLPSDVATGAGAEVRAPAARAEHKLQSCGDLGLLFLWVAPSRFWSHHWVPRGRFRATRSYVHPLTFKKPLGGKVTFRGSLDSPFEDLYILSLEFLG